MLVAKVMTTVPLGFNASDFIRKGRVFEDHLVAINRWQSTGENPKLNDEQIVQFLIACNNNLDHTKRTIDIHFRLKSPTAYIFNQRNVLSEDLQAILNVMNIAVMPERYQNYAILIVGLKNGDYRRYSLKAHFKIACMTLDRIIYDDPPQGIIYIFDAKLSSIMHITKMNVGLAKTFIEYNQYGSPLQIIQSHFLNTNGLLNTIINLTKPFMNSELLSKFHFFSYRDDMEMFYRTWVPKRYLPMEYGGDLESISVYHERNVQKLIQMQPYFDAEERQRLIR